MLNFRYAIVLVALLGLVGATVSCKTTTTTTKRRSSDPLLEKFASNFDVGEEGYMVSQERSEYETKQLNSPGDLGVAQYEVPETKRKAFEGGEEYKTGWFGGQKRQNFEGANARYETTDSNLGSQQSPVAGMKPVDGGTYQTGTDAVSGETIQTGADRAVQRRQATAPDPLIIESGADAVSVEEVREMLQRQ